MLSAKFLLLSLLVLFGASQAQLNNKAVCGSFDRVRGYCTDQTYWEKFAQALKVRMILDPNLGPKFLRLAFHGAGTYNATDRTFGVNGGGIMFSPMRFDPQNAGLAITIDLLWILLEDFPEISCADAVVLSGVVALDVMQGPEIDFRPGRQCWRSQSEATTRAAPTGLLPDAIVPNDHANVPHHNLTMAAIRNVFTRMGFNDQETVALIGAHSVGQARLNNTGYRGRWTAVSYLFGNGFFKNLVQWTDQYEKSSTSADTKLQYNLVRILGQEVLMMLPSDMGMYFDARYSPFVRLYAADADRFNNDFTAAFTKLINQGVENRLGPVVLKGSVAANSAISFLRIPQVSIILAFLLIILLL
jgi:cytochrome c peroxidase